MKHDHDDAMKKLIEHFPCPHCNGAGVVEGEEREVYSELQTGHTEVDMIPCETCGGVGTLEDITFEEE